MGLSENLSNKSFSQRLAIVRWLFLLAILGILVRALFLQVYLKDNLEKRAKRQYQQSRDIQLQRGTISDANGALLAVSLPMRSYFAVPPEVTSPTEAAKALAPILKTDGGQLFRRLTEPKSFTWLSRRVHPMQAALIDNLKLEGVRSVAEYKRFYPLGREASQLLGFVGVDSKGLEGLEYGYNQHLMDGSDREDAWNQLLASSAQKRLSGGSIQLSLDSRLQYYVQSELKKGVAGLRAHSGVAVLMETKTGRILGMASAPDFDPNQFRKYPEKSYFNRAVGVAYEPGSTFKVITIATALQNKVVSADDFFFCENGAYPIQDRVIHDTKPHGWLSLEKIIQKSSNICAAKIGALIPRETFHATIKSLGFGGKSALGLPAESAGKVYDVEDWTPVKVATMSYGHAISVTPVQMTAAINSIANKGVYMPPRIVDELRTANGELIPVESQPAKRIFDVAVAKNLTEYMHAVTQEGGTGWRSRVKGLEIAAKSGTSRKFDSVAGQYSAKHHISSFIGFFPAQKPWVTLYVMIDDPARAYLGSRSAVPVFRQIVKKIKDLNPDMSTTFESPAHELAEAMPQRLDKTPMLGDNKKLRQVKHLLVGKSLRTALFIASREGLKLRTRGSGIVRNVRVDTKQSGYLLKLSP